MAEGIRLGVVYKVGADGRVSMLNQNKVQITDFNLLPDVIEVNEFGKKLNQLGAGDLKELNLKAAELPDVKKFGELSGPRYYTFSREGRLVQLTVGEEVRVEKAPMDENIPEKARDVLDEIVSYSKVWVESHGGRIENPDVAGIFDSIENAVQGKNTREELFTAVEKLDGFPLYLLCKSITAVTGRGEIHDPESKTFLEELVTFAAAKALNKKIAQELGEFYKILDEKTQDVRDLATVFGKFTQELLFHPNEVSSKVNLNEVSSEVNLNEVNPEVSSKLQKDLLYRSVSTGKADMILWKAGLDTVKLRWNENIKNFFIGQGQGLDDKEKEGFYRESGEQLLVSVANYVVGRKEKTGSAPYFDLTLYQLGEEFGEGIKKLPAEERTKAWQAVAKQLKPKVDLFDTESFRTFREACEKKLNKLGYQRIE